MHVVRIVRQLASVDIDAFKLAFDNGTFDIAAFSFDFFHPLDLLGSKTATPIRAIVEARQVSFDGGFGAAHFVGDGFDGEAFAVQTAHVAMFGLCDAATGAMGLFHPVGIVASDGGKAHFEALCDGADGMTLFSEGTYGVDDGLLH